MDRNRCSGAFGSLQIAAATAAIVGGAASASAQPAPRTDNPKLAAAIHRYFDPVAAAGDLSGVLRVEQNGQVTEVRFGYADWQRRRRFTGTSRFAAGSVAKSMVATIVIELVRTGRIDRAASVATYVPEYRHGSAMTVESVLRHTAGLAHSIPEADRSRFDADGFLTWLNSHPPAAPVPPEPAYSNVGYELLALIAERVSGVPIDRLVQDRILSPLGMTQSMFAAHAADARSVVLHEPGPPPAENTPAADRYLPPSGRLFASAADLARWARAVRDSTIVSLRDGQGTWEGSVYPRTIDGHPALWMQGTIHGGSAVVVRFLDADVTMVIALNLESYPIFNTDEVVAALVFGHKAGRAPIRPRRAAVSAAHRTLAGTYDMPEVGRIALERTDTGMSLVIVATGDRYHLTPASGGRLIWRVFNAHFSAPEGGAARGVHLTRQVVGQPEPSSFDLPRMASAPDR